MRQRISNLLKRLKAKYSKLSALALLLIVWSFVPDSFSRADWWSKTLGWGFHHLSSAAGRVLLLVAGVLLILLDQQRRKSAYDINTLQGRTLAFCDELRVFQKELGREPTIDYKDSYGPGEFTEKNKALTLRGQKMHHGFHLHFMERATDLWHEHGSEMRESHPLYTALLGRIDDDERLNAIISEFSELAKMSED